MPARRRSTPQFRIRRVRYVVAPAEASGLPGASVDCAVAAQAAHWFDLDAYYREVRRVARPGGLIALVTYAVMDVDPEIDADRRALLLAHARGALAAGAPPGGGGIPVAAVPLRAGGRRRRWRSSTGGTPTQLLGYVGHLVRGAVAEEGGPRRCAGAVRRGELRKAWGDPSRERLVRWPLSLRLGRVKPARLSRPRRPSDARRQRAGGSRAGRYRGHPSGPIATCLRFRHDFRCHLAHAGGLLPTAAATGSGASLQRAPARPRLSPPHRQGIVWKAPPSGGVATIWIDDP